MKVDVNDLLSAVCFVFVDFLVLCSTSCFPNIVPVCVNNSCIILANTHHWVWVTLFIWCHLSCFETCSILQFKVQITDYLYLWWFKYFHLFNTAGQLMDCSVQGRGMLMFHCGTIHSWGSRSVWSPVISYYVIALAILYGSSYCIKCVGIILWQKH